MINKKSIWFMTLFSLIIVLSVYYITIPKEMNYENTNDIEELIVQIKDFFAKFVVDFCAL